MKQLKNAILSVFLVLTVLLSGCASAEIEAKKAFVSMMDAFKECNREAIDNYYSFNAVTSYIDEVDGEEYRDAVLTTLYKMDYKINSSMKTNDTTVIINVDITTLDFSEIIENYINEVMETVESKEYQLKVRSMTTDEYKTMMAEKMVEAINNCEEKIVTKNVSVMMVKSGDAWVLGGEADVFLGVLFADMSNAVNSLT